MPVSFIAKHIDLKEGDKRQIADRFKEREYAHGEILLKEGGYARHLYFVKSGFVRSFYHRQNGKEKTHWIYGENDFCTSWYGFFTQEPSFESLEVLGEAVVCSIGSTDYGFLYENNERFNAFINGYYQQLIAEMDYLGKSFVHLSAKEKYQYLLRTSPKMVREIKLGVLASLLDISQETLSRVRRQL